MTPTSAKAACGDSLTPIAQVQGDGSESPLAGKRVTIEGVITQDDRGSQGLGGFYLQSVPGDMDNDPRTSEALFIYTRKKTGAVGHRVRISGRVKEYYGLTELAAVRSLEDCGSAALPPPVQIAPPWPDSPDAVPGSPESLEGMRVSTSQPLTVIDTYNLARFGTVTLAPKRQYQPTALHKPGKSAQHMQERQSARRLLLDDGSSAQNPFPVPYPSPGMTAANTLRTGSKLTGLTGVMDFRYDEWRLQPEGVPQIDKVRRPPSPPAPTADSIRVASFNLHNFFNGDGKGGGFPTARGADSPAELKRQRAKLIATLKGLDADIVSLVELENDGFGRNSSLADLTRHLGPQWRFIDASNASRGHDRIRVGMAYRPDRVRPMGSAQTRISDVFGSHSRAPLAQIFSVVNGDGRVRVVANHFKSRSCRGAQGDEQAQGDGQGCYADVRSKSARQLLAWLAKMEAAKPLTTVITGDLNAYPREVPLQLLAKAGYINPFIHNGSDQQPPTTFRYHGREGMLDYTLVRLKEAATVAGTGVWHTNADEPRSLNYNLEYRPPGSVDALYTTGPWRASDHDPVYVDIRLSKHSNLRK